MRALTEKESAWVLETLKKIEEKMTVVTERNKGIIPYTTMDGKFDDKSVSDPCWWTNGFWGGEMWQLYALTGNEMFRQEAVGVEEKLDKNLMNTDGLDHDNGFKWLPTSVIRYKQEKNKESLNRAMLAANNMAGRFNLAGNFIRAWNNWDNVDRRGFAIIDCMMNLPLLYWASEETTDPRFKMMAVAHADTAMKTFVREDGSVNHIVVFDPFTGKMVESLGGQGYGVGSSWTRGQSWGVYGFALSYGYTGDKKYLETSKKIADYVISELKDSYLVPIDYRQP
ncbi:MAG: glycoside hydrolase family 88 protein, partial [Firmicutes bacterium]|nr:glycoside hydrolase family 88 protein [Bacillota bacterium]